MTPLVQAESAAEKGLKIAREVDARDAGWKSSSATMKMVLISPSGQQVTRDIRMQYLEGSSEGDGDKTLSIFDSPKDVQGTAFLSFAKTLEPDDQWLYLPALKRVKRISSANKSGPFMGSEFSFEDLSANEVAKFTYEFIREEVIDSVHYHVVRNFPAYEHSGYQYRDVWIDQDEYRVSKIEYVDRKGELLKTLKQYDYKLYQERFWRAQKYVMTNHQNSKVTELYWQDYRFDIGLTAADFNRNTLMRSR
ncbi:MAG: outer membrane lipoprotein-sorting protein [Cellvibrio sp.]